MKKAGKKDLKIGAIFYIKDHEKWLGRVRPSFYRGIWGTP